MQTKRGSDRPQKGHTVSLNLSHISHARLVDWADGRLPPDQQPAVAAHLAECARCRGQAERITRLLAAMRGDDSQDAPPALIARAVQLFRSRAAEPAPSLLQRLTAVLRFESSPLTPAFGLRGASEQTRQLLFAAGDYDVDLRIVPAGSLWQVSGQVLGAEIGAGAAELAGAAATLATEIDALSAFSLPPAPAGRYALTLTWPALAIAIDDLRLGAP